jgi:hypothetical protein
VTPVAIACVRGSVGCLACTSHPMPAPPCSPHPQGAVRARVMMCCRGDARAVFAHAGECKCNCTLCLWDPGLFEIPPTARPIPLPHPVWPTLSPRHRQLADGKPLEDSRSRGRPFQFKVGVGQVVKGMDIAIKQMSRGQRAKVVIPAALGYGEAGAYPLVPGNAVMIYEVGCTAMTAVGTACALCAVGVSDWIDVVVWLPLPAVVLHTQLQLIDFYDVATELTPVRMAE